MNVRFDKDNHDELNLPEFSLHDAALGGISFDRAHGMLNAWIALDSGAMAVIKYEGVVGVELTNCAYWGYSERVHCWHSASEGERTLIEALFASPDSSCELCMLKGKSEYIEIVTEFISGDRLRVACESVTLDIL